MFGNLFGDKELKRAKERFEGKFIVEQLKTKTKRHEVVWIGRSKHEDWDTGRHHIRIGMRWEGKENVSWSNIEEWDRFFDNPVTIEN